MQALRFEDNILYILDQTKLPNQVDYLEIDSCTGVYKAIKNLSVRGAPAIGIAAGYGIALAASSIKTREMPEFLTQLENAIAEIKSTRPTAQNLFQVASRMSQIAFKCDTPDSAREKLTLEAIKIHEEQVKIDLELSRKGCRGQGFLCWSGLLYRIGQSHQ